MTSSSTFADSDSGGLVVVLLGVLSIGFSGCTLPEPTSLTPKFTAIPFCSGGSIYFRPKRIRHRANNRNRIIVSVMLFLLCVVSSNFMYLYSCLTANTILYLFLFSISITYTDYYI